MAKYKICPVCGHKNPTSKVECEECETDLATVHVTDEAFEDRAREPEQMPGRTAQMVRICENCGTHNRPNERKCRKCGEDISDITPVAEKTETDPVQPLTARPAGSRQYMLSSLDGELHYEIPSGETVLGREAELSDYLSERLYVGRRQARLRLEDDRLTIENLRATNYTFVNNRSLDDREMELHEGDEIGLGGNCINGQRQDLAAYFRVVRK